MIVTACHIPMPRTPLVLLSLLCGSLAAAATAPRGGSADAAVMAAEMALQRGDCRSGSQDYAAAMRDSSDLQLAARAAEVALECGQYAIGEQIGARWRVLAGADAQAAIALVRAQLGQAHIAEARRTFADWLNQSPNDTAVAGALQVIAAGAGNEAALAMLRDLQHARLSGGHVQLQLAQIAADGWDFAQAIRYAAAATKAGADATEARALTMRARAGLGDADAALSDARALASTAAETQGLAVPEALLWLGRDAEAETELLKLREQPALRPVADRRLALLAFARSDYGTAEQRFSGLLRDRDSAAIAVYYLAIIAERRGDSESALRGYELLANTAFDGAARRRVAGIYLHDGERAQATSLLTPDDDANIAARLAAALSVADLLSSGGAPQDAVAQLDSALQNYPGHPEINYQRAVYLERVDADAAIKALDTLAHQRPADMNVANALGFTLADHNRELPRAEQLVRSALRAQPDNPAILDSLGWVLFRRGQAQVALPYLQRAFRLYHDGDIGAHCGEVLWKLGRQKEARAMWQLALAADPESTTLAATAHRYAPDLAAPKPPAVRADGQGTAI